MPQEARSCPSCGARVAPDANSCDLCGSPVEAPPSSDSQEDAGEEKRRSAASSGEQHGASSDAESDESGSSLYCNDCGWENPEAANYCSQCGSELQDVSSGSSGNTRAVSADLPHGTSPSPSEEPEDGEEESREMGQQIMLVVGTALVLVLGLFFVTQWSQQYEWNTEGPDAEGPSATERTAPAGDGGGQSAAGGRAASSPSSTGPAAAGGGNTDLSALVNELSGPVSGAVSGKIDSLKRRLRNGKGGDRREMQSRLVQLYIGAGAPGRAALVQSTVAEQTGRVEDERRVADLLYKWMRKVESEGDRAKVADVARHVAEAYAAVVEKRSQDLDARTRMGEAYLLTNRPMRGIRAINQVLETDSTFVPARFQKGLALLQINRLDEAVRQFEKVMRDASEDDPFYRQAQRAITVIRKQTSSSNGTRSSGS